MLYCSLLYLHQSNLRVASKPSPASGDTEGSPCHPVTTTGCQTFLCVFGVRPGNNCSTTWQLLKPDGWGQAQTALCAVQSVQSLWPFTSIDENPIYYTTSYIEIKLDYSFLKSWASVLYFLSEGTVSVNTTKCTQNRLTEVIAAGQKLIKIWLKRSHLFFFFLMLKQRKYKQ